MHVAVIEVPSKAIYFVGSIHQDFTIVASSDKFCRRNFLWSAPLIFCFVFFFAYFIIIIIIIIIIIWLIIIIWNKQNYAFVINCLVFNIVQSIIT